MATVLDDGLMQELISGSVRATRRLDAMAQNHDDEIRASQRRWTDGQNYNMRCLDSLLSSQICLADENIGGMGSNLASVMPTTAQHPALPVPFGWPTAASPNAVGAAKPTPTS